MSVPPFDIPSPKSIASARVGQMIQDANLDAVEPSHGAMPTDILKLSKVVFPGTLISDLIQANHTLYSAFLKNCFCKAMAWDILPFSAYQYYAKQDFLYLLDSIRFKALRFSKSSFRGNLSAMSTEARKVASAVDYAEKWRKMCIDQLDISAADIDNTDSNVAQIAYSGFLQNEASLDDWFSLYVITVPCTFGWNQIAEMLDKDPKTKKDTVFYRTWIEPNLDSQYAQKLSQFLEANRAKYTSMAAMQRWNALFRTALKLELALFNSALPHFFPLLRNLEQNTEHPIRALLSEYEDVTL